MTERRNAHPYYMYEAIHQQPDRVAAVLETERALIERAADAAATRNPILLVGIGTSYHAAQVAEHFLRHLTGGRAHALVEQSFELVHYPLALNSAGAVVVVSHRGWKNYSVQALAAARAAEALTIAVTGKDTAEGMKAADFVLSTCEQEDSYAHTKSYTTALGALAAFALRVAERRGQLRNAHAARAALAAVPGRMRQALASEPQVREVAREIAKRERWIFVGAGPNGTTAREAALKVKETSYMAAEGFETEQFLHGPLAELDSRAALVAMLTGGPGDERARDVLRASAEVGALSIAAEGVESAGAGEAAHLAAHSSAEAATLRVPRVEEWLSPLVQVVPLQLLSYYVALERRANPDTGREDQPQHARARQHYKL